MQIILAISCWLSMKFINAFFLPDPDPPIINILYGRSEIFGHFILCSVLISLV